jgi:hypothetical protein
MELPGVAAASDQARDALGRAHRHRANLRRWPVTAAEASLRAARASAVLDGGLKLDEQLDVSATSHPVFAGALRVAQALEGGETALVGVWQRAPLQALARLHMLAAADMVDESRLGRPRADADVGPRLELLGKIVTGDTRAPAPVIASVAHGELLTLAPFGCADGVVARAVSRLVTTLLFGVTAADPASGAAVAMLAAVAVLACYLPAARAARIDPLRALRCD